MADEAVHIGPSQAQDSYLNISKILEAIKVTKSEAVHPGYGFLSENTTFVKNLEDNNIVFVGPSSDSIRKMGDKIESKRTALAAGVTVIPGFEGEIKDTEHCLNIARSIGYPVMIKASAGGGGKGMRIAFSDEDVIENFKLCKQESISSFGDDRLFLEKYIEEPRHVEVQILADKYGNVVHLNERECSIQRRHQKVIEEAPSTFLNEKTRKEMCHQAVKLCKEIGYYSAGTVEFLMDKNKHFYFLEMNTRIQVEHPITECITGIDLVENMIKIAKGETLSIIQNDIQIKGWAIESRVFAEDPRYNFGLPNIGRLYKYKEPNFPGVRCDSGVEEGTEISIYYDSLICKLVGFGKTREEAIWNSIAALDSYVIQGVTHNISLLRDVLISEGFKKGLTTTNFLEDIYPDGFSGIKLKSEEEHKFVAIAGVIYVLCHLRNREYLNYDVKKWKIDEKKWDLVIGTLEKKFKVNVKKLDELFYVEIFDENAKENIFKIRNFKNLSSPIQNLNLNDKDVKVQLVSKSNCGEFQIIYLGMKIKCTVLDERFAKLMPIMNSKLKQDIKKFILAPMPGLVKQVFCKVGDIVRQGEDLCVLEAMKMQNSISALAGGKIKEVFIDEGDSVGKGNILIEME